MINNLKLLYSYGTISKGKEYEKLQYRNEDEYWFKHIMNSREETMCKETELLLIDYGYSNILENILKSRKIEKHQSNT